MEHATLSKECLELYPCLSIYGPGSEVKCFEINSYVALNVFTLN